MDPLACTGYSIEAELELELLEFEVDDQSDDVEENSNQGASTSNRFKLIKESLANDQGKLSQLKYNGCWRMVFLHFILVVIPH